MPEGTAEPDEEMSDAELAALLDCTDFELRKWRETGNMVRYIHSDDLAALLRVSPYTPALWANTHKLAYGGYGGENKIYASYDSVNKFLANQPHTFATPPTIEQLESGELELMTIKEVADWLGYRSEASVFELGKTLGWQTIRLGKSRFINKADVETFLRTEAETQEQCFTQEEALFILGYSVTTLKKTIDAHLLRRGRLKRNPSLVLITKASMFDFLPHVLEPQGSDPIIWVKKCLDAKEKLVSAIVAQQAAGATTKYAFRGMVQEGVLQAVRTPFPGSGSEVHVPGWSIREYLATQPALTDEEIASALETSVNQVRQWREAGELQCPFTVHRHQNAELKSPCVTAIWHRRDRQ